jgi:predicted enzyme related to lactoylglutathione lyase
MKITEFAFIIYPSTDLARSRAFYEDALGLASTTLINDGGQFYVEYEVGPHALGISNEPFLKPSGDGPHLVLEVHDFDPTIEHLRLHQCRSLWNPLTCPAAGPRSSRTPTATNSAFTNATTDTKTGSIHDQPSSARHKHGRAAIPVGLSLPSCKRA